MLVDLVKLSKGCCKYPIVAELKYATVNNFVGRVLEGYVPEKTQVAFVTEETAKALCKVQNFLNEEYGYGLLVYDAYRPKRAVKDIQAWSKQPPANEFELKRKEIHFPNIEKNQLFQKNYVAEDSGHCYGNTVDLVLINLHDGKELFMGACFDYMDECSHITADASIISEEALCNRSILQEAMKKFDFEPYHEEFWHFSYKGLAGRASAEPLDIPYEELLAESASLEEKHYHLC